MNPRLVAALVLAGIACTSSASTKRSLLDFAIQSWKSTSHMRVADAYKWLYHATLGGEHAVQDDSGPRLWLDHEWPTVGKPFPHEPLLSPLRPDGRIVRVNLRPYKAAGGTKEHLLNIFVSSARQFHADRSAFIREWRRLGARLRVHPIGPLTSSDWENFDLEMRPNGYPADDHSGEYEKAYHPAYRVVLRRLWDASERRAPGRTRRTGGRKSTARRA